MPKANKPSIRRPNHQQVLYLLDQQRAFVMRPLADHRLRILGFGKTAQKQNIGLRSRTRNVKGSLVTEVRVPSVHCQMALKHACCRPLIRTSVQVEPVELYAEAHDATASKPNWSTSSFSKSRLFATSPQPAAYLSTSANTVATSNSAYFVSSARKSSIESRLHEKSKCCTTSTDCQGPLLTK